MNELRPVTAKEWPEFWSVLETAFHERPWPEGAEHFGRLVAPEETLAAFRGRCRVAVEFRHRSWLTDEVLALLDRSSSALVLADRPGARVDPVVTGGWSYLRFHQGTRTGPAYRRAKLRVWADRIAALPARQVFVYFNNDTAAAAPHDAMILRSLLGERGVRVR